MCGDNKKFILGFTFCLLADILCVLALIMPLVSMNVAGAGFHLFWDRVCIITGSGSICAKVSGDTSGYCGGLLSKMRAFFAFGLLADLAFGFAWILSITRWCNIQGMRDKPISKTIFLGLVGGGLLCSLISWPIAISIGTVPQCDATDAFTKADGASVGGAGICGAIGMIFGGIALAIEFLVADPAGSGGSGTDANTDLAIGINPSSL